MRAPIGDVLRHLRPPAVAGERVEDLEVPRGAGQQFAVARLGNLNPRPRRAGLRATELAAQGVAPELVQDPCPACRRADDRGRAAVLVRRDPLGDLLGQDGEVALARARNVAASRTSLRREAVMVLIRSPRAPQPTRSLRAKLHTSPAPVPSGRPSSNHRAPPLSELQRQSEPACIFREVPCTLQPNRFTDP